MKTNTVSTLAAMALAAVLAISLAACSASPNAQKTEHVTTNPDAIQLMVLGTYHFDNPGQDVANIEADNVLTEVRQAELAQAVNALATFKPTVIMVERITAAPAYIDPQYAKFSKTDLSSKRDERVQIAYRLANQLGLENVYGIDEQPSDGEPDYFPFGPLMEHAQATGQEDELNADVANIQAQAATFGKTQDAKTISELLLASNRDDLTSAKFYYTMFKYDRGESQPGAELQSYWFMRNAKIFGKAHQIAKPGDRVLIVYGGGHKYWLTHFAKNTPGYVNVDPVPYLQKAGTK